MPIFSLVGVLQITPWVRSVSLWPELSCPDDPDRFLESIGRVCTDSRFEIAEGRGKTIAGDLGIGVDDQYTGFSISLL